MQLQTVCTVEIGKADLDESMSYYERLSHANTRVSRDAVDGLTLHLTAFNRY